MLELVLVNVEFFLASLSLHNPSNDTTYSVVLGFSENQEILVDLSKGVGPYRRQVLLKDATECIKALCTRSLCRIAIQ